jgi:lysyl-tRNA synthetase class 2
MAAEDLRKSKIANKEKLQKAGINPYPYRFTKTAQNRGLQEKWAKLKAGKEKKNVYSLAGRITAMRGLGKITFCDIADETGKIQAVFRKEKTKQFELTKALDIGDFVGVKGRVFRTKRGELSILAKSFEVLSKSIMPLPDKWHGLKDVEVRYRHRALDLIMQPENRQVFVARSRIIDSLREFLKKEGFLEVETPILQPVYGGANAEPFKTHAKAWDADFYLSISPELYLKRLLVAGYEKVFTVCKNFRNEDIDKTHNPEFTMSEFYQAYADYNDMMKLTEKLVEYIAKKVVEKTKIEYQGKKIDLKAPWKRMTMVEALKKVANLDVEKMSEASMIKEIERAGATFDKPKTWGWLVNELFEATVEDKLVQPTFITDHPKETIPLCKEKRGNPKLIERFEPYINGWEVGNGYSELNDPIKQRALFEEQEKETKFKEKHPKDTGFLEALEYGMPPAGGMGIGIDRLVILLTNQPTIKDVILFPQLRPENK